jgi:hypothetical protein
MSNIEHLIENVLVAMSENPRDTYQAFERAMSQKHNRQMLATVYIKQKELWAIAQYVFYTWVPNLEAEPVKHGEWKPYKTPIETRQSGWICTNCSGVQSDVSNGDTNYCPNCGARMDGDSDV